MFDDGFLPLFGIFSVLGLAGLGLWIWALVDCVQVPDDSMFRSGNKLIWVLIIVLLNWIGAIVYLAVGRPDPDARRRPPSSGPPPAPPVGSPPIPPPPP